MSHALCSQHMYVRLHNVGLHGLYTSPNIIWVIKWRRMRGVGYMARMGDKIDTYSVLVGET